MAAASLVLFCPVLFSLVAVSAGAAPLRLVLGPPTTAPPFRNAAAFFTAGPHGFNNNATLMPPLLSDLQRLGETALLGWYGVDSTSAHTEPLTDTVSTPRLLGGWSQSKRCTELLPIPGCKPTPARPRCCKNSATGMHQKCCAPADWSDIAYRAADGRLVYRWELLWTRLDPLVNNSIHPVVVLDNVDYAFVKNASIGKYGQSLAPHNLTEYGGFVSELVTRAVQRYSQEVVESFWWRVATEPNTGRGGTGQDVAAPQAQKIAVYVDYYVEVHSAIRKVLPTAVVGPGNWASWYQTGMYCNSSTGKHANEGLTLIGPILTSILQKGGTIGFLAMSYYGTDQGNFISSNQACPKLAGCGYDPRQARVAAEGLRQLRTIDPALADVTLQVHEFAAMDNGHHHGASFEPGAFGGAWTLATCIEFASQGIDRVFHWNIGAGTGGYGQEASSIDSAGHKLYFGNAWVMAAARKLFGSSKLANVSILVDASAATTGSESVSTNTLARQLQGKIVSTGACANTTASGIGGPSSTAGVGLLLNIFSQRKDCSDSVDVELAFVCAACISEPQVEIMVLNHTTSVYEQILKYAASQKGWLAYDDGEVYPLNMMLTPKGVSGVKAQAPHWLAQQQAVFTPRLAVASDGVSVACTNEGGCTLKVTGASPPSTYAIWVNAS